MRLAVVLLCLVAPLACSSYSLVRYAGDGAERPSVAIVTLANDSAEPGVEMMVSDALRREVLRRGGARLVAEPGEADWVVRGRVASVDTDSASLSTVVLALERSVTMRLELEAEARDGEKLRLPYTALSESERVFSSADLEVRRTQKLEALRRISSTLAVRIHDAFDEEWAR